MPPSPLLFTGLNAGESVFGRIAGGEGIHFITDDGRRLLDASDTASPLGHAHPEMVDAVRRAAGEPVINEGWPYAPREAAARELLDTAFDGEDWVGGVRFFLSGSEANDLACSLAMALTGRQKLATRERAYHGMTGFARDLTVQPHWHGGLSRAEGGVRPAPHGVEVVQLPAPDGARPDGDDDATLTRALRDAAPSLDDVAAMVIDYTQGGRYYSAAYQDTAAAIARSAGALWIADEVVTGLGRHGGWFAFQGADARPDVVILGKPLAGGAAPAAAVVLSQRVVDELAGSSWQTYSTFRGHPIMIAAMRAHLRVVERDGLVWRAREGDAMMERLMLQLKREHPSVERVAGHGFHWTVELRGPDWRDWRGDVPGSPLASRVANRAAEAGVLIGTSGEQTSLFLAPPLIATDDDVARIFTALDHGLELADSELDVPTVAR